MPGSSGTGHLFIQVSDSEYTAAFIGGDNYQLGVLIGEQILKDHPEGGKLGMLNNPLARSVTSRVQGILDTLEGSAVEVVASAEVTLYEEVLPAAETLLSEYPEINILWGFNDDITLLMHSLVLAAGRQDRISLYGTGSLYHDAVDILLQAVEKALCALLQRSRLAMGRFSVAVISVMETLKAEYLTDSQIINQDNLDNYETEE
ncbi:MAG: substrate-binding domain-containing protein [Holdemania massiliensis]